MCGIYCEIRRSISQQPNAEIARLLKQRGPDHYGYVEDQVLCSDHSEGCDTLRLTFAASVLGLRRDNDGQTVQQPFHLENGLGFLCWNGEAWMYDNERISGSDTNFIANKLSNVALDVDVFHRNTLEVLGNIRGPFAFIYYNKPMQKLYYGRDCVGRRSLLRTLTSDGSLVLSSVAYQKEVNPWEEVEADGIYTLDLSNLADGKSDISSPTRVAYAGVGLNGAPALNVPFPSLNTNLPMAEDGTIASEKHATRLNTVSEAVVSLKAQLQSSIQLRLPERADPAHEPVAILFSGGLDCTLLARLVHDRLHPAVTIDLLNVAFENPRIHKNMVGDESAYETCPDRITARQSLAELQRVCPERRFNLVCINIPYAESLLYKDEIIALIYPHDTEMDISIAMALFFAARGPTESKFLFSGLGADELFGGYQRHALAYKRGGYAGLLDELQLDTNRLGKRNLGRDDRAISRWGKEARYPYLDEGVISWAMKAPIWHKVGFGFETHNGEGPSAQHVELDDKLVLRLVAKKLGMSGVAEEKKRAIQFGSRSAKMESGRTKGTQKIT